MTISFNEHKAFHNDLYVNLPQLKIDHYFDTYYFVVDYEFLPNEETEEKVKISLKNLLADWENAVKTMAVGETIYLPIDFSDQYIGTLKVFKQIHNLLKISYCTHYNMAMFPSQMGKVKFSEKTESYNGSESFGIYMDNFIDELQREYSKIKF
ncbi:hypothetical protein [Spirosoma validum]|uniref:Uncharacterized protein n=1 Tax=Spirosoma validum TaxID=2771355 RepID=A0A927B9T3_9BACT|nr:hypothetical protein [Spirosoma validum]MBD2757752.1 hypothetical protein [Spirosoma validum]